MNPPEWPILANEPADTARVVELLKTLRATGEAVVLTVAGEPKPKPRPRFGQGRAYAAARQAPAEKTISYAIRSALTKPLAGNVALVAIFYRSTRHRVDDDNLAKLVRDAANGVAFADDCQVTGAAQLVELDTDNPRTVIALAGHESSLKR